MSSKLKERTLMTSKVVDVNKIVRFGRFIELTDGKTGKLLDIGCGGGEFASFLGNRYDYYGIDIRPQKIKAAKHRGLKVICRDLGKGITFKNEYFDIVVAGEVIEHLPNVFHVLKEVHRVLKSDGVFIGSTPNGTNISHLLGQIFRPLFPKKGKLGGHLGHFHVFYRASLEALFEASGFKIVEFTGTTFLPISKYTLSLNKWLGKKFSYYSTCLVFKAKKVLVP